MDYGSIIQDIDRARQALIEARLHFHAANRTAALEQLSWLMTKLASIKNDIENLDKP